MRHPFKLLRFLFLLGWVGGVSAPVDAAAQIEVPPGSALRKELFELARPRIELEARQAVRFQGSLKQLDGWAFFTGTIVDANGRVIPVGPASSGDTAILWVQRDGKWTVVEAATGFTDVIYLDWAPKHRAPSPLFGS